MERKGRKRTKNKGKVQKEKNKKTFRDGRNKEIMKENEGMTT